MNADKVGFSIYKKGKQKCLFCKRSCDRAGSKGCFLYKPNPISRVLLFEIEDDAMSSFRTGEVLL